MNIEHTVEYSGKSGGGDAEETMRNTKGMRIMERRQRQEQVGREGRPLVVAGEIDELSNRHREKQGVKDKVENISSLRVEHIENGTKSILRRKIKVEREYQGNRLT